MTGVRTNAADPRVTGPVNRGWRRGAGTREGRGEKVGVKGNLAHNFMDLYFLCLSFHLDISNMLKTKYI